MRSKCCYPELPRTQNEPHGAVDDQLIGTGFIETSFRREMIIALQTDQSVVLLYINANISQEKFTEVLNFYE